MVETAPLTSDGTATANLEHLTDVWVDEWVDDWAVTGTKPDGLATAPLGVRVYGKET